MSDNMDCTCTVCPNPDCDELPTRTELICQTCDQATEPAEYCWEDCPAAGMSLDAAIELIELPEGRALAVEVAA